jgi:hypothetical protein
MAGASIFNLAFVATDGQPQFIWLTAFLFRTQDLFWLAAIVLLLFCSAFLPVPAMSSRVEEFFGRRRHVTILGLAICVFLIGVIGTYVVFNGYQLARDEFLAQFDASIFRAGKSIAAIQPEWRPFATALAPRFMLPIARDAGFASTYLPVNAGLRAIMGLVADPNWTSPLLAACAILATFGVARRLWPSRSDAAFISVLLVATSSQVLIMAMTSYAMTAHLALNMLWLWMFLRNDKIGHGAAITTGFLASGLHQLIFHPLFAAPFIFRLWFSNRRPLALVYIFSYIFICLFWIEYWQIILDLQGLSPQVSDHAGPIYFAFRVFILLKNFQWAGADLVLKNVLRFVAWQSPALLPLAFLAYPAIRHGCGIARELLAGILLTLVAVFILLPYQGHGWGYRYLHGLIGSFALIGGYGWVTLLRRATLDEIKACKTMFATCSAVACFVLLPAHAKQAHDLVEPYARASRAIEQAKTDIVIVDESKLLFAEDLVRNDPFLRNHPIVLALTNLNDANIQYVCEHYHVETFDFGQATALGIMASDQATMFDDEARAKLRANLARRACGGDPVVRAEAIEQPGK